MSEAGMPAAGTPHAGPATITPELVSLDVDLGLDKAAVIRALAERVAARGRATDAGALFDAAWAREETDETGLPGGIAIPHAKTAAVTIPSLAFARLTPGVDFGAEDGPADLVFLIAAPADAAEAHLAVLSKLARNLMQDDFTSALRAAKTDAEVVSIVRVAIGEEDAPAPAGSPLATDAAPISEPTAVSAATPEHGPRPRIVAVTACATGIAHTYMAADALAAAGVKADVDVIVEPQGSSGYKALDPAIIAGADAVIFAVDVDVREPQRFAGKPVIRTTVKRGIDHADVLVAEAVAAASDPTADRVPASSADGATASTNTANESVGARIKRWLLTGVSYMIPFVAGGGLLIALGFLLAGYQVTDFASTVIVDNSLTDLPEGGLLQYLGSVAFMIGATSMGFLVPVLAGFIAFAIADRPGIAPGFVAGAVAGLMGAGFIGGMVGGVLAGFIAWWIGRIPAPRWLRGLMPVVIIPLLGSIFASGLMVLLLGRPIAQLVIWLSDWLNSLTGASAIGLGIILGLMMCFDLGGPVNKVAYTFATAGLAAASTSDIYSAPYLIMGAVMCAGMVPPLAMALASTILARRSFTQVERENGKAAWLLGAAFISEGAIPFAAVDPLRVIPASMLGGAVTGAISMAVGVSSLAPHGGIFVFFAINPIWGFLLALVAGVLVAAFSVVGLKKWVRKREPVGSVTSAGAVPVAA